MGYFPFFTPPPLKAWPLLPGLPDLGEVKLLFFLAKGLMGGFFGIKFLMVLGGVGFSLGVGLSLGTGCSFSSDIIK